MLSDVYDHLVVKFDLTTMEVLSHGKPAFQSAIK